MHEKLKFEFEDGQNKAYDVTVYALSTCGFCKRALKFLRENSIAFRYIYVDKLEPDVKQQVKMDLKEKYNTRVAYPFLILDKEKIHIGFNEEDWRGLFVSHAQ
ncbi:MAG: glutaredoxin family protein [Candidatus Hodarchaeota archaeon]